MTTEDIDVGAMEVADAETWACEHGSQRLRKIAEAGLMAQSMSVYREERLVHDMPGWVLDGTRLERAINPSEEVVDAYTEARRLFGDGVSLMYHPERRCQVIRTTHGGRQVIRAAVPRCGYAECALPRNHSMGGDPRGQYGPRPIDECTTNPQNTHAAWVARLPLPAGLAERGRR